MDMEMAQAAYTIKTAKAMIASKDTAKAETVIEVLLLAGYSVSLPAASAAFASLHSSHISGGVVSVIEEISRRNRLIETEEEISKETKGLSPSNR